MKSNWGMATFQNYTVTIYVWTKSDSCTKSWYQSKGNMWSDVWTILGSCVIVRIGLVSGCYCELFHGYCPRYNNYDVVSIVCAGLRMEQVQSDSL